MSTFKIQNTVVFQKNWEGINKLCDKCNGMGLINLKGCDWCGDADSNLRGSGRYYKYILNKGGSRSSKTFSLIDCCDLYARHNKEKRITIWRDTKTDCRKTVLNDFQKRLRMTGRYGLDQVFNKTESIFTYNTSSTVEIHGTDDEETVHGLTQDVAWMNEPYKISHETFNQIDQRTSDFVFLDLNPKKNHWSDDLAKDPRTLVIHSTFKDNPFCPPEQKKKILSYQSVKYCSVVLEGKASEQEAKSYDFILNASAFNEKEIRELVRCRENHDKNTANDFNWSVYGLGLKSERPNRIYNWSKISDEAYKALQVPEYLGTDWGTVDPWAIVKCKYMDGVLYVHQLNYLSENQWREQLTNTELSQINAQDAGQEDKVGIVTWLFGKLGIDRSILNIVDTNRPLKGAILRRAGYNVIPAVKGPGSIEDGIDILQSIKVCFTASSEQIEYEQENYSRKVDSYGTILEEPEDTNNHLMDAIRYVAAYLVSIGVIKSF